MRPRSPAVRYGRVPKRPREDPIPEPMLEPARNVRVPNVAPAPSTMAAEPADSDVMVDVTPPSEITKDLSNMLIVAHRNNNIYTEDLRRTVQVQALVLKVNESHGGSGGEEAGPSSGGGQQNGEVNDTVRNIWYNLACRMTPAVQQVVDFAKRMPDFQALTQDDQLIIIKLGFIEVWMVKMVKLATPHSIVFEDGTAISQSQLAMIYDGAFAEEMMSFMRSMAAEQPSEGEIAMLNASLLMCSTRNGLSDSINIATVNATILESLRALMTEMGVADVQARMSRFVVLTQKLRALSARHQELLGWCREHWRQLTLPPLFAEIFDIPKDSEDIPPPPPAINSEHAAAPDFQE